MKKTLLGILFIILIISVFAGLFSSDKKFPTGSKIAVISISGVISSNTSSSMFGETNSSLNALKSLAQVKDDNSVKGVILKINSPGGTVGMSQRIYNEITDLRKTKPVVAIMEDVAASGGYYVASACDRISALPGTMTGSIGVIMSTMDVHKLLNEKLLISENVIKSGKYKDMGSSSREMTEDERNLLQDLVNDSYYQFKEAVIKGRVNRNDKYNVAKVNLSKENLDKYADGRIFTGRQALEYGFVDSIDGMKAGKEMIKTMVKEKFPDNLSGEPEFVIYNSEPSLFEMLGLKSETQILGTFIDKIIPKSVQYSGRPLYLWE